MWRCTESSTAAPCSTAEGSSLATSSHCMDPPTVVLGIVVVEEIAEPFATAMEANLGRRHRDAELLGDLLVRQPVDVFQHDEHAKLRRQLVEGDREPVEQRGRLGRIL